MEKQYQIILAVLGEYEDYVPMQVTESEFKVVEKVCKAIEVESRHTAVRLYSKQEI